MPKIRWNKYQDMTQWTLGLIMRTKRIPFIKILLQLKSKRTSIQQAITISQTLHMKQMITLTSQSQLCEIIKKIHYLSLVRRFKLIFRLPDLNLRSSFKSQDLEAGEEINFATKLTRMKNLGCARRIKKMQKKLKIS